MIIEGYIIIVEKERKMSTMGLVPFIDNKQRHEEFLRKAEESRMLDQAMKTKITRKHGTSRLLAILMKELSQVGFSLEVGYGSQADKHAKSDHNRATHKRS
jgi:hypothetical protein